MDFFQGSSTPTFISFCLENQNEDDPQVPTNTVSNLSTVPAQVTSHASNPVRLRTPVPSPPPFPPLIPSIAHVQIGSAVFPYCPDSSTDVTSYASEMVQRMEEARTELTPEVVEAIGSGPGSALTQQDSGDDATSHIPRTSTPEWTLLRHLQTCHTLELLLM